MKLAIFTLLPCLLTLLGGPRLIAQEMPDPVESRPDLVFKLNAQRDNDKGQQAEGFLEWRPTERFRISGDYVHSTLAASNPTLAATGQEAVTQLYALNLDYRFGTFGFAVKGESATESQLLTFRRFGVNPYLEGDAWHLELEVSRRDTDYDRIDFTNVRIARPSGPIFVSGYADLTQQDTALGASLDLSGEIWHGYASYTHYSYDDFRGTTDVTAIRDPNGQVAQAIFNAIARRLEARLARLAGSRATKRAGILDETATLGADARLGRWKLGLELGLDKDHVTSDPNKTATGLLAWDATRHCTVELRPGATQTQQFGTISFVGLTVILRTIPKVF